MAPPAASEPIINPFHEASELNLRGDTARITQAAGYASHGEPARLVRRGGTKGNARGPVREVWLGGSRLIKEAQMARELTGRYGT